jgi:hypothetical protein
MHHLGNPQESDPWAVGIIRQSQASDTLNKAFERQQRAHAREGAELLLLPPLKRAQKLWQTGVLPQRLRVDDAPGEDETGNSYFIVISMEF